AFDKVRAQVELGPVTGIPDDDAALHQLCRTRRCIAPQHVAVREGASALGERAVRDAGREAAVTGWRGGATSGLAGRHGGQQQGEESRADGTHGLIYWPPLPAFQTKPARGAPRAGCATAAAAFRPCGRFAPAGPWDPGR